jgi:hypothetical protein
MAYAAPVRRLFGAKPATSRDAIFQENSATVKRPLPSPIRTLLAPLTTCHSTAVAKASSAVSACAVKMQSSTLPLISNGMANPLGAARVTSHLFLRAVAKQNAAAGSSSLSKNGEHNLNLATPEPTSACPLSIAASCGQSRSGPSARSGRLSCPACGSARRQNLRAPRAAN